MNENIIMSRLIRFYYDYYLVIMFISSFLWSFFISHFWCYTKLREVGELRFYFLPIYLFKHHIQSASQPVSKSVRQPVSQLVRESDRLIWFEVVFLIMIYLKIHTFICALHSMQWMNEHSFRLHHVYHPHLPQCSPSSLPSINTLYGD